MQRINRGWVAIGIMILIISCHDKSLENEPAIEAVRTPVTIATVTYAPLNDSIELNATSAFLQYNYVKANATGYVRSVYAKPGEYVNNGKVLFTLETKEASVIGHSISSLDSNFKFNGLSTIRSSGHGFLTQLNHQQGDYVQDGEQLAVISDMNSFVFLLNLPYELRPFVVNQQAVELMLPDGTLLHGRISSMLPIVDSATQTQSIVIRVNENKPIPQNLIARVHIARLSKKNAQTLPKTAVLTDEAQTMFWVMKMIDSTTAVKTMVKKGMEWKDRIEILEPVFSAHDSILVSGNYGLPDTAKVIIEKP